MIVNELTIFKAVSGAVVEEFGFMFDNIIRTEYGSPVEIKDKLTEAANVDQSSRYPVICFITPCPVKENGSQKSFEPEIWIVAPRGELKYSDEKKEELFEQQLSLILDEFNKQLRASKYIENFQISLS